MKPKEIVSDLALLIGAGCITFAAFLDGGPPPAFATGGMSLVLLGIMLGLRGEG